MGNSWNPFISDEFGNLIPRPNKEERNYDTIPESDEISNITNRLDYMAIYDEHSMPKSSLDEDRSLGDVLKSIMKDVPKDVKVLQPYAKQDNCDHKENHDKLFNDESYKESVLDETLLDLLLTVRPSPRIPVGTLVLSHIKNRVQSGDKAGVISSEPKLPHVDDGCRNFKLDKEVKKYRDHLLFEALRTSEPILDMLKKCRDIMVRNNEEYLLYKAAVQAHKEDDTVVIPELRLVHRLTWNSYFIDANGVMFQKKLYGRGRHINNRCVVASNIVGDTIIRTSMDNWTPPEYFLPPANHVLIKIVPIPIEIVTSDGII